MSDSFVPCQQVGCRDRHSEINELVCVRTLGPPLLMYSCSLAAHALCFSRGLFNKWNDWSPSSCNSCMQMIVFPHDPIGWWLTRTHQEAPADKQFIHVHPHTHAGLAGNSVAPGPSNDANDIQAVASLAGAVGAETRRRPRLD